MASSRRRRGSRIAPILCALAAAWALAASVATLAPRVQTEDQNHDGRPDVWRVYDAQGQLESVAFDTNFDGRSDVQEYYRRGTLIRLEADRDFNDRVDLVQEFDQEFGGDASASVRSVVDTDFDGTADVVTIFQNGAPVFAESAAPQARAVEPAPARTGNDRLASLNDPFRSRPSLRGHEVAASDGDEADLAGAGVLLPARPAIVVPARGPRTTVPSRIDAAAQSARVPSSPRAPPDLLLLS
jgi:hypothetical protein